ncbi:hypothetical protein WME97_10590 [Sorangium sp. So ce367]|uniref:hypothetical protein n=1 Tax=Sorangium sp. So ce367 TaxID=3133305 RepID=UPI003F62C474
MYESAPPPPVHAKPTERTSLEALQALGEIRAVRRSLELYRAQPAFTSLEDLAARVRSMIAIGPGSRLFDA